MLRQHFPLCSSSSQSLQLAETRQAPSRTAERSALISILFKIGRWSVFWSQSTVYRSVGLPPVGLCRCTSNASDKYARCHGWGVAANIWAKAVEAAVVYLLHEPEHLQRDARLPRHLVTKLVVLAHEVDRKGVVVLATEHIGAAGLPEEGVAGRHADGVPEVHKINPTSFGCPESAEFSRE